MNWLKIVLFASPVWLTLFILSYVHIDVFTYKESHNLERFVFSSKDENLSETYPNYPDGLGKDERLTHKEGLNGIWSFVVTKIRSQFKAKEEEDDKKTKSQHASNGPGGHGFHTASKVPAPELPQGECAHPLEAPAVPASVTAMENPSVGTSAADEAYSPDFSTERIQRIFNDSNAVLMGSFCVDPLRAQHLDKKEFLDDFLSLIAQFDLLAIQGIYSTNSDMLERITIELSRRTGRTYGYTAVFPKNTSANRPVPVFFYDKNVLEVDPSTIQLVGRPNAPFSFPPLAAKYRVKKAPAERAFTFYAVNVQLFPGFEKEELNSVPAMVTRLKEASTRGRFDREDDVVIFGYFGLEPHQTIVGDERFNEMVTWANPEYPTNTFGSFSYVAENILFETSPLAEYDNRSGIWDLRKQFHRYEKIPFDHHPVWACFSIFEGGNY